MTGPRKFGGEQLGYGAHVQLVRITSGMTQEQFAKELNISLEILTKIENDSFPIFPQQFNNFQLMRTNPLNDFWQTENICISHPGANIDYVQMRQLFDDGNYKEAQKLIEPFSQKLHTTRVEISQRLGQFLSLIDISADNKLSSQEYITELMELLESTQPNLKLIPGNDYYFSIDEYNILRQAATKYDELGNSAKAINILECLLQSVQNFYTQTNERRHIPANIAFSLGLMHAKCGNYERAMAVCEIGINFCMQYRNTKYLHNLLYGKANYYMQTQPKEDAKGCAIDLMKRAYYGAKSIDKHEVAEMMKNNAASDFGIIL